jgi:hypothetical protein
MKCTQGSASAAPAAPRPASSTSELTRPNLPDTRLAAGAAKESLGWYDATPRADVLHTLLGEVERELMIRMGRQAAGAAGRTA